MARIPQRAAQTVTGRNDAVVVVQFLLLAPRQAAFVVLERWRIRHHVLVIANDDIAIADGRVPQWDQGLRCAEQASAEATSSPRPVAGSGGDLDARGSLGWGVDVGDRGVVCTHAVTWAWRHSWCELESTSVPAAV